jgi:hypothetical protein
VVVVVDWWVSLWSLPPKEAMVALVSKAILGGWLVVVVVVVVVVVMGGGDNALWVMMGEVGG